MKRRIALTLALAALLSTQSQARIAIKKYKGDAVIVRQSNGKYSLIGTNHKPIITHAETISKRDLGYFIVKKDLQTALINREDRQVIPYGYDKITTTESPNLFIVKKQNQYAIVDLQNELRYGMTSNRIEDLEDHIDISDPTTGETIKKLDYQLREIK